MRPGSQLRPSTAIDFLHRHDDVAGLLPAADRLLRLRADLLSVIPAALGATCEVTGFDDATVTLRVASSSAAAKLRQTLPRVQEALTARGWAVDDIRLRVKPRQEMAAPATWLSPTRPAIPVGGVTAFAELADRLDGDSPLRGAVDRLLRRRG